MTTSKYCANIGYRPSTIGHHPSTRQFLSFRIQGGHEDGRKHYSAIGADSRIRTQPCLRRPFSSRANREPHMAPRQIWRGASRPSDSEGLRPKRRLGLIVPSPGRWASIEPMADQPERREGRLQSSMHAAAASMMHATRRCSHHTIYLGTYHLSSSGHTSPTGLLESVRRLRSFLLHPSGNLDDS